MKQFLIGENPFLDCKIYRFSSEIKKNIRTLSELFLQLEKKAPGEAPLEQNVTYWSPREIGRKIAKLSKKYANMYRIYIPNNLRHIESQAIICLIQ